MPATAMRKPLQWQDLLCSSCAARAKPQAPVSLTARGSIRLFVSWPRISSPPFAVRTSIRLHRFSKALPPNSPAQCSRYCSRSISAVSCGQRSLSSGRVVEDRANRVEAVRGRWIRANGRSNQPDCGVVQRCEGSAKTDNVPFTFTPLRSRSFKASVPNSEN